MAVVAPHSSTHNLTRREKATLRANWSELTAHLVPPGIAWTWGESGLSERMKHYLRAHGLIRRHGTVDDAWETTDKLWMWVISNAADDEPVGAEATGQETLPVEPAAPPSKRTTTGSTPPRRDESRQVTLTDDVIDTSDPVNIGEIDATGTRAAINARKDPTRLTGKEAAAHHPSQTTLDAWTHQVGRLTRPSGDAYGGEPA